MELLNDLSFLPIYLFALINITFILFFTYFLLRRYFQKSHTEELMQDPIKLIGKKAKQGKKLNETEINLLKNFASILQGDAKKQICNIYLSSKNAKNDEKTISKMKNKNILNALDNVRTFEATITAKTIKKCLLKSKNNVIQNACFQTLCESNIDNQIDLLAYFKKKIVLNRQSYACYSNFLMQLTNYNKSPKEIHTYLYNVPQHLNSTEDYQLISENFYILYSSLNQSIINQLSNSFEDAHIAMFKDYLHLKSNNQKGII